VKKLHVFYLLLLATGIILTSRLFYLQLYSREYVFHAVNTSIKNEIIIPNRGYIFDRNKNLLVFNQPVYELTITPNKIENSFDRAGFIQLTGIDENTFLEKLEKAKAYAPYLPSSFLTYIDRDDFARIQEKLHRYKGFEWVRRSLRDYKVKSSAKLFGYIGEVSPKQLKIESDYYEPGDFVGISGVEKSYEKVLRGEKGVNHMLVDHKGRVTGPYREGKEDKKAKSGSDIYLTIDWSLQEYAEKLMYKKKGSVVAIDPKTGEILALVSTPVLDPHLLAGKDRSKEISRLYKDTINRPLFNRATDGLYPPGSPFKILTELAALQMGTVDVSANFVCQHGFSYGNKKMKCHCGIYGRPKDLETAVERSCNSYFAQVYIQALGKNSGISARNLDQWSEIIQSFGLGRFLNNDLDTGQKGRIPSGHYYDKQYGAKRWNALTTLSNSIGQGEISTTPLQLANVMAAVANKGFFYTPHIVKTIGGLPIKDARYTKPKYTKVEARYFESVIRGMEKVFLPRGTASEFQVPGIRMAGKTGTSENFIRVKNKRISLPDHSIFTLFAPVENSQIAIAVMIENGSWGSKWAGPIASLVAEKYIASEVKRKSLEGRMMNNGLQRIYDYITTRHSEKK